VRKLKKGSSKYKGKFPFKCFNYGEIGHYAIKYPLRKSKDSNKGFKRSNFNKNNKILYSKDDCSSAQEADNCSSEDEGEEDLFMAMEVLEKLDSPTEDNEDVTVIDEEELISTLDDLRVARKENREYKAKLKELEEVIDNMKVQIEEGKRVLDCLNAKFNAKSVKCSRLEE